MVVGDDSRHGTRILRIFHLHNKCAPSAVDKSDLPGETVGGEGLAGIGDRGGAVIHQCHVSRDTGRIKSWPENGTLRAVDADRATRIHYHLMITLAGPQEHLHAGVEAVYGGGKVRVVCAGAILAFSINRIAVAASSSKIVLLEIARAFRKSMLVQRVVNNVVEIEQVLDGNILVVGRRWSRGQVRHTEELAVVYAVSKRIGFVIGILVQVAMDVIAGDVHAALRSPEKPSRWRLEIADTRSVHDGLRGRRWIIREDIVFVVVGAQFHGLHPARPIHQSVMQEVATIAPGLNQEACFQSTAFGKKCHALNRR